MKDKKFPVMVLISHHDAKTVQKALTSGAVQFVAKPFEPGSLIQRVESIIGPLHDDIEDYLYNEVNRAKRGKTSLSIIKIAFEQYLGGNELSQIQIGIKSLLRTIDSILLAKDRSVIILLPVTEKEGCQVVINKIKNVLEKKLPQD